MADKTCSVVDCDGATKRSLSGKSVRKALSEIKFKAETRHLALCREHYRDYKKSTKEERKLESLGR